MAEGFSQSKIHSHIEDRIMQAGHQLRLGVLPFLKMQTTQREYFLATSLVDLTDFEVHRLIVWHSQIPPEILKCRDFEDYWLCLFCSHCCTSFFIFVLNYMLLRKTQGFLPCVHHCFRCFRYSLGLIPSTFRNIRLK